MIVLTTLLTSTPDPQRSERWQCDPGLVTKLAESVAHQGCQLFVLHDEEPTSVPTIGQWVRVGRAHTNPYFARWSAYRDFLAATGNPHMMAWCVDATDVELLHMPSIWPDDDEIYCGSEPDQLSSEWLTSQHPSVASFAGVHSDRPLYNAGILGGRTRRVLEVVTAIADLANDVDFTDMGAFNLALHTRKVVTGLPVHTQFRAERRDHPTAWWRHK